MRDVLGTEQAERRRCTLDLHRRVRELLVEGPLQARFGVGRGEAFQQGRQAIVERQLVQRPAGAAVLPGGFQRGVQCRRHGIAGEPHQVVVAQVARKQLDRLHRTRGDDRRGHGSGDRRRRACARGKRAAQTQGKESAQLHRATSGNRRHLCPRAAPGQGRRSRSCCRAGPQKEGGRWPPQVRRTPEDDGIAVVVWLRHAPDRARLAGPTADAIPDQVPRSLDWTVKAVDQPSSRARIAAKPALARSCFAIGIGDRIGAVALQFAGGQLVEEAARLQALACRPSAAPRAHATATTAPWRG